MYRRFLLLFTVFLVNAPIRAAEPEPLPNLADRTKALEAHRGFVDLYWDDEAGRVLLKIDRFDEPLILVTALAAGVGSNDIGLDRGQLGETRLVEFRRVGRKVALVAPNLAYRAESRNRDEVRAVNEAFAESVLAVLPVVAEGDGSILVDYTDHLLSDVHGVQARLKATEQGAFKLDAARSLPLPDRLRAFPDNSVAEARLTFAGDEPGREVRSVTPEPGALSVRMQHQFVRLPDDDFERRAFHPRSGFFDFHYRDYAVPLGEAIDRRVLVRYRLERDGEGRTVDPLVYYVDRGAPEPVRSALMEGASWWAEAFAAAGFPDGYRVELLPEGIDPLDVRFNVIQWVHRSTRGWSYGASVRDPRSGEIIKGHISLGSLRVRQDMLIAEGLTAPFGADDGQAPEVEAMALARLRQLSAHEVGHTLGLAHNFAASVIDDGSVMDYPHPFVRLGPDGEVTIDEAYDTGIGEWDKLAIEYGYRVFADDAERDRALQAILDRAEREGLRFVSDPDARGLASVHAVAHLWDNGADPLQRFDELMAIRRAALDRFGPAVLRPGEPLSALEDKLVPVYLVHRYQAEAVGKLLGGLDYDHRMAYEDGGRVTQVPAERQRAALDALVYALGSDQLRLGAELLDHLQPPAFGYRRDREAFSHRTAAAFDAWAPARAAAQLTVRLLLEPSRAQRLEQQHARDSASPGLGTVLEVLADEVVLPPMRGRADDPLGEAVAWIVLREMQRLALDAGAGDRVRALALDALDRIAGRLGRGPGAAMAATLERFLLEPEAESIPPRETIPPGSPI